MENERVSEDMSTSRLLEVGTGPGRKCRERRHQRHYQDWKGQSGWPHFPQVREPSGESLGASHETEERARAPRLNELNVHSTSLPYGSVCRNRGAFVLGNNLLVHPGDQETPRWRRPLLIGTTGCDFDLSSVAHAQGSWRLDCFRPTPST